MSNVTDSFFEELEKESAGIGQIASNIIRNPALQRGLGGFGAGFGTGGVIGAGTGAALGGVRQYREAREQGASGLQALGAGVVGSLGGAAKGAVIGAGAGSLGLGGLAAAGKAGFMPKLVGKVGDKSILGSSARFGQRQVHALTGWKPEGGMRAIFESPGKKELNEALAHQLKVTRANAGGLASPRDMMAAQRKVESAKKAVEYGEKAESMGLTNLPGYAKSLYQHPIDTMRYGFGSMWHGADPLTKAMFFGYPAAAAGKELMTPSEEGGPGRLERAGKELGVLGFAMSRIPTTGALLASPVIGAVGGGLGKLTDKIIRRKPTPAAPQPVMEPAGGEATPAEYVFSERMGAPGGTI